MGIAVSQATSYVSSFGLVPEMGQRIQISPNNKCFTRQILTQTAVSLSPVDDIVAAADDDEDEEDEQDFIVAAGDLEDVASDSPIVVEESKPYMHAVRLQEARDKYKRSENDSGSPEFQIAGIPNVFLA